MGIKHQFNSAKTDGADATKVRPTNWNDDHEIDGDVDFDGHAVTNIADEAYNQAAWDGNLSAPTKNALRDKIEALVLTGGGVTDFLALDDSPDTYTGFDGEDLPRLGVGATVQVNAAGTALEFKYSTADYIDIRDFGTFPASAQPNGDIGPALQACFDDLTALGGAFTASQHIRVPKVGAGVYSCSAVTFPTNMAIVLELDAQAIVTENTWVVTSGQTIIGRQYGTTSITYPYGPAPKPIITGTAGMGPVIQISGANVHIEGLSITSPDDIALFAEGTNLLTVKHCRLSTGGDVGDGDPPAMKIDSCFWGQLDNLWFQPGINGAAVAGYSCEFTTDFDHGTNNGIMLCRDWVVNRNGILFRAEFGPVGVDNTTMDNLHSENMIANTSLVTFDSTNGIVGNIYLRRCERSDSVGTVYTLKNIGTDTNGVYLNAINQSTLFDPASTPINNFVLDNTTPSASSTGMPDSLYSQFVDTAAWATSTLKTPSCIDTRLLSAPIGLPWVPYTPLPIVQNPASWTLVGSGTVTTGILAPDGSTLAGQVTATGAAPSGAHCYSAGGHTLATGDWIVFGVWVRQPTGGSVEATQTGIDVIGAGGNSHTFNNTTIFDGLEDGMTDYGWRWCATASKVVAFNSAANPSTIRFNLCRGGGGTVRQFFNPCATLIPASAGYDQVWIMQFARAMKGGFSSSAVTGEVSMLDHQTLYSGAGLALKDGVTAPSTISGQAQIYVDTADGDLKVKFGDGTVKTIVVDT